MEEKGVVETGPMAAGRQISTIFAREDRREREGPGEIAGGARLILFIFTGSSECLGAVNLKTTGK